MPIPRQPLHADLSQSGASLVTRNLRLHRGRTSIRLEQLEWAALDAICLAEGIDRHAFASLIDRDPARHEKTLTSRIRSAILNYYIARSGLTVAGASTRFLLGPGGCETDGTSRRGFEEVAAIFSPAPAAALEESRS